MSTKIKISVLLFVCILAAACGRTEKQRASEQKTPIKVGIYVVSETESQSSDSYVGLVKASRNVVLSAPHMGSVETINVKVGSVVAKGDILAEIDSKNVNTSYEISQATLKQAEDGYERVCKVYQSGTVPDVKMVEIETQLAKAKATAMAAKESLEECKIKAPFSGTVCEIFTGTGLNVNFGAPMINLVDISTVEIAISIPEKEISLLEVGQKATVSVPAIEAYDIPATLTTKGIVATALSHAYECMLKLDKPVKGLMPGMVTKVTIGNSSAKGFLIPASAVETDINGRFVWTVNEGKVSKTFVEIGGYMGNGVKVTSGLKDGDKIIVQGAAKVSSGMKVETVVVSE